MPESRLEKCRESYQIVNCKVCGLPTANFEGSGICGGCIWKAKTAKTVKELSGG